MYTFCCKTIELIGYRKGINFDSFVCTPLNTGNFHQNKLIETETKNVLRNAKTFCTYCALHE